MRRVGSTSGTGGGTSPAAPGAPRRCGHRPRSPTPRCTGNTGLPVPLPHMEPTGQFDMWRDYLGLPAMVAALLRDPAGLGDPSVPLVPLAPCAGPAPSDKPRALSAGLGPRGGLPPCSFCQRNGESPVVYRSHSLRDAQGRLQCPVLRNYVCPQCGATQDQAHTRSFCPLTHRGYTSVYSRSARARSVAGKRRGSTRM